MKLLVKFESQSNRVKGIAFHPKRPWVLVSLHNGAIQLWDYRMGTLLEVFEEHEGPVRGIAFHPTQDIFCSGGDDRKLKVWSITTRRCLFTLTGHADYIRTVSFHHELPWILSASDDQTLRIWNWQSRNGIATLTGHNHYVMCGKFHPSQDLIASACLDLTIRVWDFSALRQKYSAPESSHYQQDELKRMMVGSSDAFGSPDVVVKFILEGHTKGVNWVDFHPTLPLLVSGGDDRQVKLWRMSEQRAWEVDTCRGHYNNVSCVVFHPRQELLISNSEDRSIRVWDMSKRTLLQTFRRETDRYWVLAVHPHLNLFAAGHDGGLMVFKLERERPAMAISQDTMVYIRENHVRVHNFSTGSDQPIITLRKQSGQYFIPPRTLTFNPVDKTVILSSESDGGVHFELFRSGARNDDPAAGLKGSGHSAIFVSRNRFVVLDKEKNQLDVRDMDAKTVKTIQLSSTIENIFAAPGGNLILSSSKNVILYDVTQKKELATLQVSDVKYVVWSPDNSQVALLSKHHITIAIKEFEQQCQIHETIRVKSGSWDPIGVFIYTTLNHIKYLLPQGDIGIICTLDQPIYVTRVKGQNIHYLDRKSKPQIAVIDPAEYKFKLALIKHDYDQVIHAIRNSNLVGQSIIAYLRKKGYSEIALHFIKDERTRFELALECGNLEAALTSAKEIDSDTCWVKLAREALVHGQVQTVITCYQRLRSFDRLTFLYFITGDIEKVKKMQEIAEKREDFQAIYQNSIYLGDASARVKVLRQSGQNALAYLSAKNASLNDLAEEIAAECEISPEVLAKLPQTGEFLAPPTPAQSSPANENWPTLNVSKGVFDRFLSSMEYGQVTGGGLADDDGLDDDLANGWGDDLEDSERPTSKEVHVNDDGENEEGWGLEEDLEISDAIGAELVNGVQNTEFTMPQKGISQLSKWARNSPLAADHVAAGAFESAMQLLNRQLGIVNFVPLKPHFLNLAAASQVYLVANPGMGSLSSSLRRNVDETNPNDIRPVQLIQLPHVIGLLKEGYKLFKANKLPEALTKFSETLQLIPLLIVSTSDEQEEVQQMLGICREYIIGLQMEQARRELAQSDPSAIQRGLELAAFFTHCELDPQHLLLALRLAMTTAFKAKNFVTAASFARRLLELGPSQQLAKQARDIQTVSERTPHDEVPLDYDQFNPFVVCARSFTPIYQGSQSLKCPFCSASYKPDTADLICSVCQLSQIDAPATGLRNL